MSNQTEEYTPDEMLSMLRKHFEGLEYEVTIDSEEFYPVRVPFYAKKTANDEINEVVVDFTTFGSISKEEFLPSMTIDGVVIEHAAPVAFYQYYFIHAKSYLAYPDYATKNKEFNKFVQACKDNGIGLLEVSRGGIINTILEAHTLYEECSKALGLKSSQARKRLEGYLNKCLHYFVYYPEPDFKRRAITGKTEGKISFVLIDALLELKHISFKGDLVKLAYGYRKETREDYQIALETIKGLWLEMSGVKYPEIQRQLEDILLRDSRYRDHFLHQFQVFLLGAYIIDKMYACKSKCLKDFKKKSGVPIENAWLFASTYHDFNYSIQRYDTWSQEFFSQALSTSCQLSSLKLDSAFIRENFLLKTGEICELLGIEMDNVVMNFFFEQATMERNHGLLSALSLLKLFENSGKSRMPRHALVQAALAIAIHDNGIWLHLSGKKDVNDKHTKPWNDNFAAMKVMENLTLQDYPLAFLLVFCDTVQEWGRVGGYYTTSLPLLEDIDVIKNPFNIEVSISVKDNDSYQHKEDEIEQVAEFLKDNRFVIKLRSRTGNKEVKVPMEGTV